MIAEAVVPEYDDLLRPITLSGSGGNTYVTGTSYSVSDQPLQYTFRAAGQERTQVTNTYEWGTRRLHNSLVTRGNIAGTDKSATYRYDQAGNVISITDVSRDGTDAQCFSYDHLTRLTEAWAQGTDGCATTPSASVLGGPAPYWQSFIYYTDGDRKSETEHSLTGDTAQDTVHNYSYPPAGSPHPHFLGQVDTTGPNGTSQATYTPDEDGNTATRTPASGNKQTFGWDTEGHIAQVNADHGNGGTATTSYVYDADGNRLITRAPDATTLFLGNTEISLATGSTTPKATRYYDRGDGNQAVRTDDNQLSFLIGDHHGTGQLAINSTTQAMQERRTTPFGTPRGTDATAWPGDKGFIGGTNDPATSLTHLGARDYDPTTGRFTSLDPLLTPTDPQSLNGYAYANNNPETSSDPTGTHITGASDDPNDQTWRDVTSPAVGGCGGPCVGWGPTKHSDGGWIQGPPGTNQKAAGEAKNGQGGYTYPAPQAEDSNRKAWNSESPSGHDHKVFLETGAFAMSFMAYKGYGNAYTLLEHWLENSGDPMWVDVMEMMEALPDLQMRIDKYLHHPGTFDSGWRSGSVSDSLQMKGGNSKAVQDWYYALNGYQYRVQGKLTADEAGKLHGTMTVDIYKRCNWGNPAGGQHRGDLGQKVAGHIIGPKLVQNEMAHLNTVGLAHDFDVLGRATFDVG